MGPSDPEKRRKFPAIVNFSTDRCPEIHSSDGEIKGSWTVFSGSGGKTKGKRRELGNADSSVLSVGQEAARWASKYPKAILF